MSQLKRGPGRPALDPSKKVVKTGLTLPPDMVADLDYLAKFTKSNRSAVLVSLLQPYLHDVMNDALEASHLLHVEGKGDFSIGGSLQRLLLDVARDHHSSEIVFVIPPVPADREVNK